MASLHIDFMNIIYSVCQYSCQVLIMCHHVITHCHRVIIELQFIIIIIIKCKKQAMLKDSKNTLVPRWRDWFLDYLTMDFQLESSGISSVLFSDTVSC